MRSRKMHINIGYDPGIDGNTKTEFNYDRMGRCGLD
jgi:hypothetical protein